MSALIAMQQMQQWFLQFMNTQMNQTKEPYFNYWTNNSS